MRDLLGIARSRRLRHSQGGHCPGETRRIVRTDKFVGPVVGRSRIERSCWQYFGSILLIGEPHQADLMIIGYRPAGQLGKTFVLVQIVTAKFSLFYALVRRLKFDKCPCWRGWKCEGNVGTAKPRLLVFGQNPKRGDGNNGKNGLQKCLKLRGDKKFQPGAFTAYRRIGASIFAN